ncbi:MAG: peptidoglycan DD-metalloendopeptidase family protein [Candidatus Nanopelagicales bacterium]
MTVVLPRTFLPAVLAAAAMTCAAVMPAHAADPSPSPSSDPGAAATGPATPGDDMAAGLAPLLAAADDARAERLAADKRFAEATAQAEAAQSRVTSQKGSVADARDLVGSYARAAYRSGPGELAFIAGLLDSGSPTDLMRRVDDAERVGSSKDTEYQQAQRVLLRAQRQAARAADARDRASTVAQDAAAHEAAALADITDYTGRWADQLAAAGGGSTDQDRANSVAAQAWSDWLARPEADGAPTVTAAMVATGKHLPDGVFLRRTDPGVAFWSKKLASANTAKARRAARAGAVLLLPDRTVQMVTYGVSKLQTAYQWRANADDSVDCAALVDRAWNLPGLTGAAATAGRPTISVAALAQHMTTVPASRIRPGDVVFYADPGHGVNHVGLAVSGDQMIAAAPLTGGVNATDIDPDRVWRVGRPAASGHTRDLPVADHGAWQCGSDPDDLAQISPGGWMFPTDDDDWHSERINPGTEPGMRMHPVLHYMRCHAGWDSGDAMGDPIYAVADGVAVLHPNNGGAGNMVSIAHGGGVESVYMHLSEFAPGINGQIVKRGQLIGKVGSTGLSSGPHLHFETHINGQPVDPRHFFYNDPVKPAC